MGQIWRSKEQSRPPFAKASAGSLRPKAGLPAEALAKAGGGQASLPSLTDAWGFDIQGVALAS